MTPPRRDVRRRRHGASMTAPAAPTPPRGDEGALTRARSRAQFVSEASNILRSSPVLEESLVAFARFAVPVLADPGMGRKRLLDCIERIAPSVLVGVPRATTARALFPASFASVRTTVTVGPWLPWGGRTLASLAAVTGVTVSLADAPGQFGQALRERAAKEATKILLVVDQLEELFTLSDDPAAREAFLAALLGAADDPSSPVRVVLSRS